MRRSVPWKHLIICPDRALFHGFTAILAELTSGAAFTDIPTYPVRRALADLIQTEKPNLCFVDVSSSWDSAVVLLNELGAFAPSVLTIAISSGNNPDVILQSLR